MPQTPGRFQGAVDAPERWDAYTAQQTPGVRATLASVVPSIRDRLRCWPVAATTVDGACVVAWEETTGIYVEFEIEPDGAVGWFVKDRIADTCDGGEMTAGEADAAPVLAWLGTRGQI